MTPGKTAPSLRDILRQSTRDAHDRVDTLYGTCNLAWESDYRRFLTAQAAAWLCLRPGLDAGNAARTAALLADLDTLGIAAPPPLDPGGIPASDATGLLYVLEGSRLGSTLLLRDLQAAAPALAEKAGHYLAVSADLAGWRDLSARLQLWSPDEGDEEAIIADARITFGVFEKAWWATEQ